MYTIATLEDLRRHLKLGDEDRGSDDHLLQALAEASHLIESATARRYCPRVETLGISPDEANPRSLLLPDDLLELRAVRDGSGAIDLARIRVLPGRRDEPAFLLQYRAGGAFRTSNGGAEAVSVTGVWGWHSRWASAWRDSGDRVSANALSADSALIGVQNSDGADTDGRRPRFHIGHLLRIDGEYLRISAIDRAANQLTVLRGVGGTRVTAHLPKAKIETYAPEPAIRDLTVRYAEQLLKSAGPLALESMPLLRRMRRVTA
jgi:hypothetical protein